MRQFIIIIMVAFTSACEMASDRDLEKDDFTGNKITYNLYSASEFNITGYATFKEKIDGSLEVDIMLSNTSGKIFHPVHIHEGAVNNDGKLVSVLNPVLGEDGNSKTVISSLMVNESVPFTYDNLLKFNGSIRIHLDGGPGQNVILSAANIGSNPNADIAGIAVCKDW